MGPVRNDVFTFVAATHLTGQDKTHPFVQCNYGEWLFLTCAPLCIAPFLYERNSANTIWVSATFLPNMHINTEPRRELSLTWTCWFWSNVPTFPCWFWLLSVDGRQATAATSMVLVPRQLDLWQHVGNTQFCCACLLSTAWLSQQADACVQMTEYSYTGVQQEGLT